MKQLSFWPSPFVHAVVMAPVAVILRRLTLIAILSVSKRNGPQPPPSHIKPIMFGNELRNYHMIPKEGQSLNSDKQYFILTGMSFLLLQLAISLWQVICKTHGFSLSRIVCKRKKPSQHTTFGCILFSTAAAKVTNKTKDSKVRLHGGATLDCYLTGVNVWPLNTFWWVPNHPLPLLFGQETNVSGIVSIDQTIISNDTVQSTLQLENFNADLSGQYLCGSENAGGMQKPMGAITLQVLPEPGKI